MPNLNPPPHSADNLNIQLEAIKNGDISDFEYDKMFYRLVKLVTRDKRLKLIGVLIDSDPYVWQRPFLMSMYEAKKLDCIVCEELSELCFNNKTYMEIMLLLDKGLDVLAVDGNGFLMSVK